MPNYFGGYSPPQQYQQPSNNVIVVTVQGEQGASMYPVAAGNTVLLIDFNLKRFWLKATDINGLPARFAAFDFTEVVKPVEQGDTSNFVSRSEFDEMKRSIDRLVALVGGNSNAPTDNAKPATVQPVQATVRELRT